MTERQKYGRIRSVAVPRKKTTVYLDPQLIRAAKVVAAATGRHDYEVIAAALRRYLSEQAVDTGSDALRTLLDQIGERSTLSEEEGMRLAYDELHAMRRERQERGLGQ